MFEVLEQALGSGQKQQADAMMGHLSIFDLAGETNGDGPVVARSHPPTSPIEWDRDELLRREKETLGLYVSSHPLSEIREQLHRRVDNRLSDLTSLRDGQVVTVGGLVTSLKPFVTRKGDQMVFAEIDDATGSVEVVVFANTWQASRSILTADAVVLVKGRVDQKAEGEIKIVALEVAPFEATPTSGSCGSGWTRGARPAP